LDRTDLILQAQQLRWQIEECLQKVETLTKTEGQIIEFGFLELFPPSSQIETQIDACKQLVIQYNLVVVQLQELQ
jgi:hypothetical protein